MSRPMLSEATSVARASRKVRRAAKSKADKAARRRAARRAAETTAKTARLAKYAAYRRRQLEIHGLDGVRAHRRQWRQAWLNRHLPNRRRYVSIQDLGPVTMAAIDAAKGDLRVARMALGIDRTTLHRRTEEGDVTVGGETMSLRSWLDATWPQRGGHRAVEVASVHYEGKGLERVRVYVLAAHGEVAAGEHLNRVLPVGVVRQRVVCQQCKEARSQ